jgi:putative tricarboxylic transport membrane protein
LSLSIQRPSRRTIRTLVASAASLALAGGLAACTSSSTGGSAAGGDFPSESIEYMVPSGAGGGWDTTARTMQDVMQSEDVVTENINVFNVEGGGGATGLAQMQESAGDPHAWMMTGLVMHGALQLADSELSLAENSTPIATLTAEPEAFVVPASSPYQDISEVVDAYVEDPKSVTFGGGSAGGSDQMVVAELMEAAGGDAAAMKYVPYDGGGEAVAGILSGDVEVGVSGVSEFEQQVASGKMRLLAISTAESVDVAGEPAPTLKDAGYDIDFSNWRGLVAAPGLSDADVESVRAVVDELHGTQAWQTALEENGWLDFYKTGDEAEAFFRSEGERVAELYEELGL